MGFLDKIKGWLNIGGVKVQIEGVNPMVSKAGNALTGKAVLTSKSDKQVVKLAYKFVLKKTTGRGDEKKTKEFILGQSSGAAPFEIKAGETKTFDFSIPYSIEQSLKDMGGVLGTVGKLAAFAAKEKMEYFVIAKCDVKGTALSPKAELEVEVVD
jgi:sporulation-control protein spo0M